MITLKAWCILYQALFIWKLYIFPHSKNSYNDTHLLFLYQWIYLHLLPPVLGIIYVYIPKNFLYKKTSILYELRFYSFWTLFINLKKGGDLLSHIIAVPSALLGLTSLFEMGRGEPQCYNHPKGLVISYWFLVVSYLTTCY